MTMVVVCRSRAILHGIQDLVQHDLSMWFRFHVATHVNELVLSENEPPLSPNLPSTSTLHQVSTEYWFSNVFRLLVLGA